jgi:outer membrane protein OmpA-like peptidoglycan-associated protein
MLACIEQTEHLVFRLELIGHASGDERDPEELALARARALERYFTACGVPVLGLSAVSAGARKPLLNEPTERAYAQDTRRVRSAPRPILSEL